MQLQDISRPFPRTQNGFGRGRRWVERINKGLHRRHKERNLCSFGGDEGPNLNAHGIILRRDCRFAPNYSSSLDGWKLGALSTPSSGQIPNCVKLLRWRFFHLFWVQAFVLRSLSLLRDAFQRRNLESLLGVYGLVVEWVVSRPLPLR